MKDGNKYFLYGPLNSRSDNEHVVSAASHVLSERCEQ